MSVLERIKSLFGIQKKDENNNKRSDEEVLDQNKQEQKVNSSSIQTSSKDTKIKSDITSGTKTTESISVKKEAPEAPKAEEVKETPKTKTPKEEKVEEVEETPVEEEKVEEESDTNKESDSMTLLQEDNIYSMDDIDKEFTQKFIDAGIETVDHCFQCGTCSGGCPSGRRTPYKVRQIVRKCLLGLKEEVITDDALWMCTTCYTCQERCPRSVKIVEIIKMARNVAAHAGYMADAHKATGEYVIKTGHGVPINDKTKALRKEIGLSEVPPTTHAHPEALAEVQKICKITAFDDLIGYNE